MTALTSSQEPLAARYGSLFRAIVPAVSGFVLWGQDFRRRAAWGDVPESLDARVSTDGRWAGAAGATLLSLDDLAGDRQGCAWTLVSDSGRFVGAFALVWAHEPAPQDRPVSERVKPAVECLRLEVSSAAARGRAAELQWQQAAGEWYPNLDVRASLDVLLADGLKRVGCQAAMLYLPLLGMSHQACDSGAAPEVVASLNGLRTLLDGLAGKLSRYVVMPGRVSAENGASVGPLLIIPTRSCGGRFEVLLAFLMPPRGEGFSGQAVLRAQGTAFAATRRVDLSLDNETGLLSRVGLDEARQHLAPGPGALLLADIDRHQSVNTVHGLEAGDMLLREVAGLFRRPLIPAGSLPARLHAGCFALLLPGKTAGEAAAIGHDLQSALAAKKLRWGGEPIDASVRCGVTSMYDVSWPLDPAFSAADLGLRLAKERGRGRVEISDSGDSTIIRRHDEILAGADLHEALQSGRLLLFAQKIVPLADVGSVAGFELLVRMRDRITGATIPPKDFIAAAQRYGLLPEVDRYVADVAFQALATHRELLSRGSATFSINVSGASVGDGEFVDFFLRRLRESRFPPSRVTLEITEQAAVAKLDRAADMMRRLREVGCGIAIDDFGTGANSLAYLRSLPLTRLKIDGSFVKDMLTNPRSEAAVRGIVEMARNFRLETVAEFVENGATTERLRSLGIDYGQGYQFGMPQPIEEAILSLQGVPHPR
ncbi:MAG: hypothetical protein RLZZ200_851 [Pseudomonadota bacterium]